MPWEVSRDCSATRMLPARQHATLVSRPLARGTCRESVSSAAAVPWLIASRGVTLSCSRECCLTRMSHWAASWAPSPWGSRASTRLTSTTLSAHSGVIASA